MGDHLRQARHGALMAPKRGCVTAESPFGGQTGFRTPIMLPSGDQANSPAQQAQRWHCAHRCPTVWGFSARGSNSWAGFKLVAPAVSPEEQPLGPLCLCHPNRDLPQVWGGWRVGVLPMGCRDLGLSVPVLQGGSTSEQTSERENWSRERRSLVRLLRVSAVAVWMLFSLP